MPIYFQAMLPFAIPNPPSSLTATATSTSQITLNFTTNNLGSLSYQIFQCSGAGCTPKAPPVATIGPIVAASISQPISGLNPSTSYSFYVVAVFANGLTSQPSNTASATTLSSSAPSAPGNLTATAVSSSQINLAWTASTEAGGTIATYNVFENGVQIGTTNATTLTFAVTGLAAATSYNFQVSATDTNNNTGPTSNTATAQTFANPLALNFPRIGLVANNGDQSYGQATTTGFVSYSASGPGTPAYTVMQQLGSYDIVMPLGGSFEGWQVGRTKQDLVNAIKGKGSFANLKNASRLPFVFLYAIMESSQNVATGAPYQTLTNLIRNNNWWTYTDATRTTILASPNTGFFEVNYVYAWNQAAGSAANDTTIVGNNYGSLSNGQGPAQSAATYFASALLTTNVLDSRFTGLTNGAAPNADGLFLDNCFLYPNGGGNLGAASGSWDGVGTQGNATLAAYPSGACSLLARGQFHFFTTLQSYLASCNPGSTYYNIGNLGTYANTVGNGNIATISANGIANTFHGGLIEDVFGSGTNAWQTFQTFAQVITNYNFAMDFCQAPKLVGVHGRVPQTDGSTTALLKINGVNTTVSANTAQEYQMARIMLGTALMDNGFVFYGGATNYGLVRYYDEFGDDSLSQVNVKRGYLGQPVGARPTGAAIAQGSLGVWVRQFANGVVVVNPWGNGAQTITAVQIAAVTTNGPFNFITGTQATPTNGFGPNGGGTFSSVSLADPDAVILVTTASVDPFATRGPQAGDVWLNWNAASDGTGTQANPFKTFTSVRLLALTAGQALWVQGTGPWPNTGSGAQSGTATNRVLIKQWPGGSQGGFTFTGDGQQTGGGSFWDIVGLTLSCAYNGICLGDNYSFSGGSGLSTNWRFIDCVGTRTGDATKTDNQGIIYCTNNSAIGIQIIRGSYTGPSGEGNNQSSIWMDYAQNILVAGTLFNGSAQPIYFKHTNVDSASTPGGTVKNCIFLNAGRALRASLNYVQYTNNGFYACPLGMDEQGGGLGNSQNCTLSHNTFINSDWLCAQQSGGAGVDNNTITNNASVGTSRLLNAPFSPTNPNNSIDYTANDGAGVNHYYRNSVQYTLAGYQSAFPGQEPHGVAGTITLVSSTPGATPTNWAMTSGVGKGAASDGTDCGVNASKLLTVN